MKKIENWNELQEKTGEVATFDNILDAIKAGPQVVKILKVEDVLDKKYLKIAFDVADGPLKGIIRKAFDADDRDDKKWPFMGLLYKSYKKTAERFFAAFITSIEKSNANFVWDFDEQKLKGKLFVANFAEEEYLSDDRDDAGNTIIKMSMKVFEPRSLEALKNQKIKTKEPKLIEAKSGQVREGSYNKINVTKQSEELPKGNFNKNDSELPF